jgi:hypothetical protein
MNSKSSKKRIEFTVAVTDYSKKTESGFPFIGDLLIIGEQYELQDVTDAEEKVSAKLSHIIWQGVNILPLVKAMPALKQFHSEMIEYAAKLNTQILQEA